MMEDRLEIGTLVIYRGSITEYHGELYTVSAYEMIRGDWRYDLRPLVIDADGSNYLYRANRKSLEVV